jgi:hypothetical protein
VGIVTVEHDQIALEDAPVRSLRQAPLYPACHVVIGPGEDKDAPLHERPEVAEVYVGIVDNHNVSLGEASAQLLGRANPKQAYHSETLGWFRTRFHPETFDAKCFAVALLEGGSMATLKSLDMGQP